MRLRIFLLAESLFNLGLFVFFLLYNLHLLDRGFDESFIGLVAALQTAGSVCGTLPAGWFAARFGVGAALQVTFAGGAAVCAMQAAASARGTLLALSFLGGLAAAFRTVSIAPAVAQLASEKERPRAFSLFFALAIGMGIIGGLLGGRMPEWIGGAAAKQKTLWAGSGICALALAPTLWLRFARTGGADSRRTVVYPWTPFVRRYLGAAAAWNLFVGAFPPFFNTFMARRFQAQTSAIGAAFSGSQLAQVGAILAAPVLFGRLGLRRGIALTQATAALLLALLAPSSSLAATAVLYAAYMSFQWMSEPGWHSVLMNSVEPAQQSGASALNFFVIFSAQAIAVALFGWCVAQFGYPRALVSTAAMGLCASWLFRRLLGAPKAQG